MISFSKKQIFIASSIAASSLLTGCLTIVGHVPGSFMIKVSPVIDEPRLLLECQASSSGKCYFLMGERYETVEQVLAGESKSIAMPQQVIPFCATFSDSYRKLCDKNTFIGPNVKYLTISQNW